MNSRLKKYTILGMLTALAYLVMTVGRIPIILFLKYDPKDIVIAIGGFIFGPLSAFVLSAGFLLWRFLQSVTPASLV